MGPDPAASTCVHPSKPSLRPYLTLLCPRSAAQVPAPALAMQQPVHRLVVCITLSDHLPVGHVGEPAHQPFNVLPVDSVASVKLPQLLPHVVEKALTLSFWDGDYAVPFD